MRTMATSSSLNPNAPLFVPAAFRRVEDFSPQWWELVKTTAWFRDHWFRQHQELEQQEPPPFDDVASLLPDSVDLLDIDSDHLFHNHHQQEQAVFNPDEVTKKMSLNSPTEGAARVLGEQPKYYEKLAQHVSPTGAFIHQPR